MLDIDDAILATTTITPGKLSLGDSVTPAAAQGRRGWGDDDDDDTDPSPTLTITNTSPRTTTYALSHSPALALAGRDILTEHPENGPATVVFSQRGNPVTSVTVRGYGRAKVEVGVTPNAALSEGALYGGYLVFTPDVGDQPLRVPYAGYKGDYQAIPATKPTANGFPWLARQTGIAIDATAHINPVYAKQAAGASFTLAATTLATDPAGPVTRKGADRPFVLIHLDQPARRIRLEVFSARRHTSLGEGFVQEFVARNGFEGPLTQPSALVTALPLDGTTRRGHHRYRLPDGEYYAVMTVEKALAERGTPKETWTSPTFRIRR